MKKYFFSGHGCFDRDKQTDGGITCQIDFVEQTKKDIDKPILIVTSLNSFSNNRTVYGYILAKSRKTAEKMLRQYQNRFNLIHIFKL